MHAKRADFLSRLRFRVGEMPPEVAGDIAVSICLMAFGFRDDDTWTFSESAQALQIVLTACNHAKEEHRGQLIQRSILAASDVTFAYRLLKSVRDGRNNFGSASRDLALVTLAELAFVELMRQRYAPGRTPQMEDADHEVFREWMDLSNEDLPLVRLCFEFFVGTSPKKLAQVTRIVYPEGIWRSDPRDIVERFLSLNTMRVILTESPRGDLTAQEMTELERLERFVVYREYRADPRGGFIRLPDDRPA